MQLLYLNYSFGFHTIIINKTKQRQSLYYHNIDATSELNWQDYNDTLIVSPYTTEKQVLVYSSDIKNCFQFIVEDGETYHIKNGADGHIFLENADYKKTFYTNVLKYLAQKSEIFNAFPLRSNWAIKDRIGYIEKLFKFRLALLNPLVESGRLDSLQSSYCKKIVSAYAIMDLIYFGKRADLKISNYLIPELSFIQNKITAYLSEKLPLECYPFNDIATCSLFWRFQQAAKSTVIDTTSLASMQTSEIGDASNVFLSNILGLYSHNKFQEVLQMQQFLFARTKDTFFKEYIGQKALAMQQKSFGADLFIDASGNSLSFDNLVRQHKGKYLFIDFWASWCYPCIAGIRKMNKIDMGTLPIKRIFVSLDENYLRWRKASADNIPVELQSNSYYIASGFTSETAKKFKINAIPRYIIISPDGNVLTSQGPSPSDNDFLKKLKLLLKR